MVVEEWEAVVEVVATVGGTIHRIDSGGAPRPEGTTALAGGTGHAVRSIAVVAGAAAQEVPDRRAWRGECA